MSLVEQGLKQAVVDGVAPSVMQTRINEPMLDTAPGVSAHKMSPEEIKRMEKTAKFVPLTQEDIERNKKLRDQQKEGLDPTKEMTAEEKREVMKWILNSMDK
jgi:hypothetical protein